MVGGFPIDVRLEGHGPNERNAVGRTAVRMTSTDVDHTPDRSSAPIVTQYCLFVYTRTPRCSIPEGLLAVSVRMTLGKTITDKVELLLRGTWSDKVGIARLARERATPMYSYSTAGSSLPRSLPLALARESVGH